MNVQFKIPASLTDFLGCLNPAGRHNLFSAAANALRVLVRGHVVTEAARRHGSADRLGARPTGHLRRGARAITFSSDDRHAEVVIPIAGMNRAFHDVTITPTRSKALTLPVHQAAYGHRVAELRRMGWIVFRPKGKDVLMGNLKGEEPVTLYALKKRVQQRKDRSLLPSDEAINSTVARAMITEIQRVSRKAG